MENTNWEFLIQVGILISLIMIYFSTRSIVEVLNHWGVKQDDQLDDMRKELERIESNTLSIESNTSDSHTNLV